jgi:hypothetical protein
MPVIKDGKTCDVTTGPSVAGGLAKGLAAEKASLASRDMIVEVNGQDAANEKWPLRAPSVLYILDVPPVDRNGK